MLTDETGSPLILVVEDVEETRDQIEKLLKTEGYQVEPARSIADAIVRASRQTPTLILFCCAGFNDEIIDAAYQLRAQAQLKRSIPVVIFGSEAIPQGAEIAIGDNIYLTQPDNFNQLRAFFRQLLGQLRL